MNIFLRELKAHRKSLIIWSVGMIFLILAGMGKYSAAAGTGGADFNDLIKDMPKSLQGLFGVGVFDLSKAMDYFGVLFLYIALMASVHAAMLGSGIISKEERDKTVEFLMAKPVSRKSIITAKLLAALTMILFFNLVTYASSVIMLSNYVKNEPFLSSLFFLMMGMLALQVLFAAIGAFFAAFISRPKLSSALATGVLMCMFMLSIIIDISENIEFVRYATFFKYFDSKELLKGGYSFIYPVITVALSVLLTAGTYFYYTNRDLRS